MSPTPPPSRQQGPASHLPPAQLAPPGQAGAVFPSSASTVLPASDQHHLGDGAGYKRRISDSPPSAAADNKRANLAHSPQATGGAIDTTFTFAGVPVELAVDLVKWYTGIERTEADLERNHPTLWQWATTSLDWSRWTRASLLAESARRLKNTFSNASTSEGNLSKLAVNDLLGTARLICVYRFLQNGWFDEPTATIRLPGSHGLGSHSGPASDRSNQDAVDRAMQRIIHPTSPAYSRLLAAFYLQQQQHQPVESAAASFSHLVHWITSGQMDTDDLHTPLAVPSFGSIIFSCWKIIDKARTSGRNEEAGEEIPQLVEWSPAEHKWKRELLFELPKEGAKHQAECAERMKVLIGKGGAKKFQTRMLVSLLHLAAAKWRADRVLLHSELWIAGSKHEDIVEHLRRDANSTIDQNLSACSKWHALKLLMVYTGQTTRESVRAVLAYRDDNRKDFDRVKFALGTKEHPDRELFTSTLYEASKTKPPLHSATLPGEHQQYYQTLHPSAQATPQPHPVLHQRPYVMAEQQQQHQHVLGASTAAAHPVAGTAVMPTVTQDSPRRRVDIRDMLNPST